MTISLLVLGAIVGMLIGDVALLHRRLRAFDPPPPPTWSSTSVMPDASLVAQADQRMRHIVREELLKLSVGNGGELIRNPFTYDYTTDTVRFAPAIAHQMRQALVGVLFESNVPDEARIHAIVEEHIRYEFTQICNALLGGPLTLMVNAPRSAN